MPSLPAPAENNSKYSALGVCNRLVASGAASGCKPSDAGSSVSFRIGSSGVGSVIVSPSKEGFDRAMNGMNFGDFKVTTSEENLVVVFWKGGGDLADAQIRLAVQELSLK